MVINFAPPAGPNPAPAVKKRRSPWQYIIWGLVIAVVGVVAWIGITGAIALKNITAKNANSTPIVLNGSLTPSQVAKEGDSRINILLAGIGGPGHAGSDLTDTLEIYSIDPINKAVALVSIPRDLYVTLPDGGKGRINVINTEGAQYCKKYSCAVGVDQGGVAMEDMIGQLLGIKINYFVRLNFQGFQQLVDAVGGVDVNVTTALNDPLYPCPDPSTAYCPLHIKAGFQHFDGGTALKYARSRETTSDFARAARQQQVIAAIRTKALTLGILGNPAKVTQLINILGKNVKTDIQPSDFSSLLNLVRQATGTDITNVIDTSAAGPLTSSVIGGADVLVPKAGPNDFAGVQTFVAGALKDPYVMKEAATIAIVNASGKPILTTTVAEQLKNLGYTVTTVTTGATQSTTTVSNNKNKPYSSNLLQRRFKATFVSTDSTTGADITVTIGSKYSAK